MMCWFVPPSVHVLVIFRSFTTTDEFDFIAKRMFVNVISFVSVPETVMEPFTFMLVMVSDEISSMTVTANTSFAPGVMKPIAFSRSLKDFTFMSTDVEPMTSLVLANAAPLMLYPMIAPAFIALSASTNVLSIVMELIPFTTFPVNLSPLA